MKYLCHFLLTVANDPDLCVPLYMPTAQSNRRQCWATQPPYTDHSYRPVMHESFNLLHVNGHVVDLSSTAGATRSSCVASASGGMNWLITSNEFRLSQTVADSVHTTRRDATPLSTWVVSSSVNRCSESESEPVICIYSWVYVLNGISQWYRRAQFTSKVSYLYFSTILHLQILVSRVRGLVSDRK